ncbi:L,D-transpeptidase [Paenibacillus aestuarii]
MAWYLLGREYAAQGKEGKAAYCFAQSGEIYEAFEKQKIVVEGPDSPAIEKAARAGRGKFGRRGKRVALLAMLLPFLLLGPIVPASDKHSPRGGTPSEPANAVGAVASSALPLQEDAAKLKLYYPEGAWGTLLQRILTAPHEAAGEAVILQAPKSADGAWEEWNKAVRPLLSIARGGSDASAATLSYYNAQLCGCQAADSAPLLPAVESWVQEREQAAVLQSAIAAYRQKSGTLPQQPEQLAQAYPDNLLPGLTPAMQAMFPQALKVAQAGGPARGAEQAAQPPAAEPGAAAGAEAAAAAQGRASAAPLSEPLRILVDTDKHRLALVSGNFLIRSYPVGLGGEKTPEGDFVISEKVRNPNGKSNGEFGSRGMTLSDTLYAIHGTNKPSSIGKDESHGCIRMKQADVEELYDMVPAQTKVTIGKGIVPDAPEGDGDGSGAGRGNPAQAFKLPLQTTDSNPNKVYKWLD